MRDATFSSYLHGADLVQVAPNGTPMTVNVAVIDLPSRRVHSVATMKRDEVDRLIATGRYEPTDVELCLVPA